MPSNVGVRHTVFLIGDVGKPQLDPMEPTLVLLEKALSEANKHSTVVFLGDNIYPSGLPEAEHPERKHAEAYMNAQLDIVKDFDGKTFFIPGNHDWNHWSKGGREAIIRQADYIEGYLDKKGILQPENGCGDPEVVELEEDVTLILLDSQWFLQNWDEEPEINSGCDLKTREDLKLELEKILDKYDDTDIIIALHHPLYSVGTHGGYYGLRHHLFPLTAINSSLWIPLPILGSVYPTLRYLGISNQDVPNAQYQEMVDMLLELTFSQGNVIFASGHEHTLQHIKDGGGNSTTAILKSNRHFIVSGSGCKTGYVAKRGNADFAYGKQGFAKLLFMNNGEIWLEMWRPKGDGTEGEVIYRRQLSESSYSMRPATDDSGNVFQEKVLAVADTGFKANKSKRRWLGKLYREAWSAPIEFPTLDLEEFRGGMHPIKKGGGGQSQTLRLENEDEQQYVMRSVAKSISRIVPENLRNTVIEDLAQDQLAMAHPYGAWVVPPLAHAAGVFHTNPSFYYIPQQKNLGEFNEIFGDDLYLVEERPTDNMEHVNSFGNAKEIRSTRRVLREIRETNRHRVDQEAVLRARLFDILIGDWDRHDDQWRWAEFEKGKNVIYQPVPRDRDQVFLSVNGFFLWFLTQPWGARMFQNFDTKIRDVAGLGFNARFFDRSFLTEPEKEDWLRVAKDIQTSVTDSVIEEAFRLWPDTLYNLNGEDLVRKLKGRRDNLTDFAVRHYLFLSKAVDIVGSDKKDRFEIIRHGDGKTEVTVSRIDKDEEDRFIYYHRIFNPKETKEIRLYGLDGKDEFILTGESQSSLKVRIIGGEDEDEVSDQSKVAGGKRTWIYDTRQGNNFELGQEGKNLTENKEQVNYYNRKAFKYDHYLPLFIPGFNVDDGLTLGGGILVTKHGFRKSPYKSKQSFTAQFAFATEAFRAKYNGDFIRALGKWDLNLDMHASTPSFVVNYFGLGNETQNFDEIRDDLDFNRLRHSEIYINPSMKRSLGNGKHSIYLGPVYNYFDIERTRGRFVDVGDTTLTDDVFAPKHFGGLNWGYRLNAVDNNLVPTRGMRFNLEMGWRMNLENSDQQFTSLNTNLSLYLRIPTFPPAVLATKVGYAGNFGDYEFFQAQTLGRGDNLRGYRSQRFAGDQIFYHNTDLRLRVYRIKNHYIPLELGLIGFVDYGRVWLEGENSDRWHSGYGYGVLVSPYSAVILSITYSHSREFGYDDGFRPLEVRLGFMF